MGVATPPVGEILLVNVHVSTFWLEVEPPVAPVNPTYAVLLPTVVGILIGQVCVNVDWHRVGHRHRQIRAVVSKMHSHGRAAVKVDARWREVDGIRKVDGDRPFV